jgi:CBS domain containing-hemolysin-like protein
MERMANPVSPTVNKRTTLKDALSMMLDADVQTGIVVDHHGAVLGLLTVESVAEKMREGEHAPEFDQLSHAESEGGEPQEPLESDGPVDELASDPGNLEVRA